MGSEQQYPKRPRFFSHRFCRVLAKACAANEIGAEACWLLTVIVNTEDAKGYRGAVTYFNEQLMPLLGLNNVKSLDRVRRRAVEAGWLVYLPGAKSVAGRYWVNVPEAHRDWDDQPTDEWGEWADYSVSKVTTKPPENRHESGEETATKAGRKQPENSHESGQHSSLSLTPTLTQDPPTPRGAGGGGDPPESLACGPTPEEVVAHWNAQTALTPATASDPNRDRAIRSRAFDPQWRENWRAVIAFMGGAPKYARPKGEWRVTLSWLFKASNFAQVIDEMRAPPRIAPGTGPPEDSEAVKVFKAAVAAEAAEKQAKRTG